MQVNIKLLHPEAVIPKYAKLGDAGMDLVATSINITEDYIEYGTGLSFEIPEGFVGLVFPRSSLSKYDLSLCNHVGVIDSSYRGEVTARFKRTKEINTKIYLPGDRICQLIIIPHPKISFNVTDELSKTERGFGGYGSSGR